MNKCSNTKCQKEFEPSKGSTGKYCSRSCAASMNNTLYPKRERRNARRDNCLQCQNPIKGSGVDFCTKKCSSRYKSEKLIREWISGEFSGSDIAGEMSRAIRNYLIAKCDNKCPLCGWGITNPVTGKVTLTVDHQDGDATNNTYGNLQVMCYNCHTLTPTFNELNRGKGTRYQTPGSRTRKLQKK